MENESDLKENFLNALAGQVRAMDTHSVWAKKDNETLLTEMFVKTKAPVNSDTEAPKPLPLNPNARLVFQAVAAEVEKVSGQICNLIVETACDGSMRGLIYSEDRVILNKSLWNSNSLYFETWNGLLKSGSKMIQTALKKTETLKAEG